MLVFDYPLGVVVEILAFGTSCELDGRKDTRCAFEPENVLVVFFLVYGLVASEVERKPFFFAVNLAFAHGGHPVVVCATGIESSVVVNDCGAVIVGEHFFAVDDKSALCLEEVFLAVKRTILSKRYACNAGF